MRFTRMLKFWTAGIRRPRRFRQFGRATPCEVLELRCLLTISELSANVDRAVNGNVLNVDLHWHVSDTRSAEYEIWIDQISSIRTLISKVYYRSEVEAETQEVSHRIQQELDYGQYRVWVRGRYGADVSRWVSHTFEIDDDNNPETPIRLTAPTRPEITVIREGQGAIGQTISEGGIGWMGNSSLYDVWLGKRDAEGIRRLHTQIRNVSQRTITLRELALAANHSDPTTFSDIRDQDTLTQLESGEYEFFVRGINGATHEDGGWAGQGPWSRGVSFSFHRIEGTDAVPNNLRVSDETRMTAEWDPVLHAEAYLVSFWKGPDYSNHRPINVRVHGTKFVASANGIEGGGNAVEIVPGDEFFVRVRAIGSEGMLEGLRAGNFAYATVTIPASLSATDIGKPTIRGPAQKVAESMPVLRWDHAAHANNYDIWFASLQTRNRMFLATGITDNVLHLSPDVLARVSDLQSRADTEFDSTFGLPDGSYRFWVRGRTRDSSAAGAWSRSYDFTVDASEVTDIALFDTSNPASQPLVSPNLMERYVHNGQQYILITNGLGESFGASVLARYVADEVRGVVRPIVIEASTGKKQLKYPDLSVGYNVADMAFIDADHLIILSRGSNDVRIVDLVNWEVLSEYALTPGAGGKAPDAMDLEVLANGQVLIVFNRSDRLRVLDVDHNFQLSEVTVPGASLTDQGFRLPQGRAMQVSAVSHNDGTFPLFLATPTVQGIVSLIYDPSAGELRSAVDERQGDIKAISRSRFAAPYVGGTTVTLTTTNGNVETFYLSTDRNGFLTWINVATYAFGFIDVISHIDDASRDPSSADYKNPDDNHADPTRILKLDGNNIAVLNNRSSSVILALELDDSQRLNVRSSSTFDQAYGAVVLTTPSGIKLFSSAGNGHALNIGHHNIVMTDLFFTSTTGAWSAGESRQTILADPADRAAIVTDDNIIVDFFGARRMLVQADSSGTNAPKSPLRLLSADGIAYTDQGAPTTTYLDPDTDQLYLAAHLKRSGFANGPEDHFLGIVNITEFDAPRLHSVHPIASHLRWYFIEFTSQRIAVLDRLGGEVVTLSDWQTPKTAAVNGVAFGERQPSTYGKIRSGRIRTLADGTNVVLHDTSPDKVFSVFARGEVLSTAPVATVHTNTAGQWIYDAHVLDHDRVIAVTWDAKVLILNVRTGVFETIKKLDNQANTDLDLFGVRETAFRDGILSVSSPGSGVVAQFTIDRYQRGVGYDVTLSRIVDAPNVVSTVLTASGQWVIESNRVRHFPR